MTLRKREQNRIRQKRWRNKNPEKSRSFVKEYYLKHKAEKFARVAARRAQERATRPKSLKRIHKIYKRMLWWRRWFDVVVDHIVPIAKGGRHISSNLQIIYAYENSRKGSSLIYIPSVVFH